MAIERAITDLGPSQLTLTGTTVATQAGSWIRWGPFKGTDLRYVATFSATSAGNMVKLRGLLTTASTAAVGSFAYVVSSALTAQTAASTVAGHYTYVQTYTTALSNGVVATVYFAAVK